MKRQSSFVKTLSTSIASLLAITTVSSHAATATWNAFGAGPFQWNAGASWLGGVQPNVSDATLDVLFPAGGGATVTNNDFTGLFLNSLTFNGGAGETASIAGNSLDFRTDGTLPTLTQNGTAAVTISAPVVATNLLTLNGTGNGLTTITGAVSGAGGIAVAAGNWWIGSAASSYTGGLNITGGTLTVGGVGAAPQSVNITVGAATVLGGTGNAVTINGGTLKLATSGAGNITLGAARPITFGGSGGILDMVNVNAVSSTTQGGGLVNAGGDLTLTLNNTAGNTAVIKFNGGQLGLSENNSTNANWNLANNVLRLNPFTGTGALRIELTNGAMARASLAAGGTDAANTFANAMTVRGVVGGDPTSGAAGTTHSGISLTTGRYMVDSARVIYNGGITFEGALQMLPNARASAVNGALTVASNGYIAFGGRGTGTNIISTIVAPGGTTNPGHNVLWIGENSSTTLTIQNGGIAVFDGRLRSDQNNAHGVLLAGNAVLNAGGTLRIAQSLSNFSNVTPLTQQNVGDIILRGNVTGLGSTASEAVLDIKLPAPNAGGTIANGVPTPLTTTAPTAGTRAYAGLVAEATNALIVNGTGFGGLRVNATARPDRIFSATGVAGGAAIPDPTSNTTKLDAYLTATRLAAVTGSSGYLTAAPTGVTYNFPAGGEWGAGQNVGLKAVDHNAGGTDVSLAAISTFGHNIAVAAGASLDTGAGAFTLSAGRLHGTGTVSGAGGVTIGPSAGIEPGLGGVGTLTVGNVTINGGLYLDVTNAPAVDLLAASSITLGGASVLGINGGSTFNNGSYTFATYTGSLVGTFTTQTGLPIGYSVDYSQANLVRLVYSAVANRTWDGTPGTTWSTSAGDANWQTAQAFTDGNGAIFDDTATGSKTITISGPVSPSSMTFANSTFDYTVNGSAGNAIGGAGSLDKTGTGSVTISGPHTYGGGTNIVGGTLRLGGGNTLPDAGAVAVSVPATLDLNGNSDTIGALTLNGVLTAGSLSVASLTVGPGVSTAANFTFNGNITRSTGAATTLSGTANLGGAVRTLDVASGSGGNDLTLSGVVSNGGINKSGNGVLALGSASNSFTGGLTIGTGSVVVSAAGALPAANSVSLTSGATLDLTAVATQTIAGLSGGGGITLGADSLTVDTAATSTYSGAITGTAGSRLTKKGNGILTLTGTNTAADGLYIEGGRVNTSGVSAGASATVKAGGILQLAAALTGNVTLDGGTLSAGADLTNVASGTWNIASASSIHLYDEGAATTKKDIVTTGTLTGSGDLAVTISGQNTATDSGNGLRFRGSLASTYSGNITLGNGAKAEIQTVGGVGSPAGTAKFILTAGTVLGGLNGTYSQFQSRVTVDNVAATFGNNIEVAGTGTVNINIIGNAGTTANFGDLKFGGGQSVFFNKNDATLRNATFSSVTLTGGNSTLSVLDPSFGSNVVGVGANVGLGPIGETTAGSGIIFKASTAGHATINGVGTYTGVTDVETGTLTIGASGSISGSSRVEVSAGAKLDVLPFGATGYTIPAAQKVNGTGDWDGRIVLDGTLAPGFSIGTITGDNLTLNGGGIMQFELSASDSTSDKLTLSGAFTKGTAGGFLFDFEGGGNNLIGPSNTYTLVQFASTDFSVSDFTYTDIGAGLTGTFNLTATELQLVVVPEPGSATLLLAGLGLLARRRRK